MKRLLVGALIILITGLFWITASVSDASSSSVAITYGDKVTVFFDERNWTQGADNSQANIFYEYVPAGQTVKGWKELVTLQVFKGLQNETTAEGFGKLSIERLYQVCGDKLSVAVIRNSPADYMFEFKVSGHPRIQDQHEIQRIITGKESLVVVHYAVKTPALASNSRARWIGILDRATVK